jgi:hypothetical protein
MADELTATATFEQRMKDRIRASIGDCLSDEDIMKLITRSMEELFFNERRTQSSSWSETKILPPLAHELVSNLMKERMDILLRKWLDDNHAKVEETMQEVIRNGAGAALLTGMNNFFKHALNDFAMQVTDNLKTIGR